MVGRPAMNHTSQSFQTNPNTDPNSDTSLDEAVQGNLPTGPIGIVSRSIPDNREFWAAVKAVTFTQRGAGRRESYRAVAHFWSLTLDRVCFASVATMAAQAGLGTTAFRTQLRALEKSGHIVANSGRSKGRNATVYRMPEAVANPTVSDPQPNGKRWVNPTVSVAKVVSTSREKKSTAPRAREVCSVCKYSWPAAYGEDCYLCLKAKARPDHRPKTDGRRAVPRQWSDSYSGAGAERKPTSGQATREPKRSTKSG